jgi:putative heme-binding domain-containing protein
LLVWFKDAGRAYVDGAYFDKYLREFRREAIATLTPEEKNALGPLLEEPTAPAQNLPATDREFVREWKMTDFLGVLEAPREANLARGRQAFVDAQCLSCHRFGNDGGMAGPELSGAGSKYSARDLLESILEPSKVLSDQYQNHTLFLKDGDSFSGRLVAESDLAVILETDRIAGVKETFKLADVEAIRPSALSPMPEGLVNVLEKEEILDLIAYLRGTGR